MALKICPICEVEMAHNHDCFEYNPNDFSLELELLGIPFSLEPYESIDPYEHREQTIEYGDIPAETRNTSRGISLQRRPTPLFLRL